MSLGIDLTSVPRLIGRLEDTAEQIHTALVEGQDPLRIAEYERAQQSWRNFERKVEKIRMQLKSWEKEVERERKIRREEVNNPSSPESLATNLRWIIEQGTREDLKLIRKLQENPRYPTREVLHLIAIANKKLSGQDEEKEDSPLIARQQGKKAYRVHKQDWEQKYAGQYIAVYQGKVIDCDANEDELASRMVEKQLQEKRRFRASIFPVKIRSKGARNLKEKMPSSLFLRSPVD